MQFFLMSSQQFGRYLIIGNRGSIKDDIKGVVTYAVLYDIGELARDDAQGAVLVPNAIVRHTH